MVSGYNPLTLMTGKSIVHPGISTGNIATESMYEDEAVRKTMEKYFEIAKKFRELEFGIKIDKAMDERMKGFENMVIQKDDKVLYQSNNEKAWLGPAKVLDVDKNWIFSTGNGDIKKVPKCNGKLNVKASNEGKEIEEDNEGQDIVNGPCPTNQEDKTENKDKNKVRFEDSGMMTRSKQKDAGK